MSKVLHVLSDLDLVLDPLPGLATVDGDRVVLTGDGQAVELEGGLGAEVDFVLRLYAGRPHPYGCCHTASRQGGVYSGCVPVDGGRLLRIVGDGSPLRSGRELWAELAVEIPDTAHADGLRRVVRSWPTGIVLSARGPAEVPGSIAISD